MAKFRDHLLGVTNIFLPGDEELYRFAIARHRDARLTSLETVVMLNTYRCCTYKENYPRWDCSTARPCVFCEEVKEWCK